jgi:hypothetical protein
MGPIKKVRLADGIFLLKFATQYELAATFLRFQEYFESSHFAGRVFSLEEFMDWYAAQFGRFSYFEDWAGFNIPSTVFEPFAAGRFDPLLEKERRLIRLFDKERAPFYVIGVCESSSHDDLTHELAHALFFRNDAYRKAVLAALSEYNTRPIETELHGLGYSRTVLRDEVHAYLISGDSSLNSLRAKSFDRLRRTLSNLFRSHGADLIQTMSRIRRRSRKQIRTGRAGQPRHRRRARSRGFSDR